jgi:deoxyribose-phosphate aldolase
MDKKRISEKIVSSCLVATTTITQVEQLCEEAKKMGFPKVCVPPLFVKKAKGLLQDSPVAVSTVIGFPLGYSAVEAKIAEIVLALLDGADEFDVVCNLAALKNNDWQYLAHELNAIMPIVKGKGKLLKIIIESGELTEAEMIKCCDLYGVAGIDFLVTATGFSARGSSRADIALLREHLADVIKIIAGGHIDNCMFAMDLLKEGADLLATSHASQLVKDCEKG